MPMPSDARVIRGWNQARPSDSLLHYVLFDLFQDESQENFKEKNRGELGAGLRKFGHSPQKK